MVVRVLKVTYQVSFIIKGKIEFANQQISALASTLVHNLFNFSLLLYLKKVTFLQQIKKSK